MKKIVALALCLVMVMGLMSGCEKAMDLDTLIQKMDEAGKTVTATGMNAELEMEMKMTVTGMTMNMGMDMEMEIKTKSDLSAMYMDMEMNMEAMGESDKTNTEIYGVMEDGVMVSYAHDDASDIWVRSTQENYGDMMNQFAGMQQSLGQFPKELMVLAEEKVTVNDRACYALTVNMSGEQFQTYMSDYMGTMMSQLTGTGELDEETLAMVEKLDWTGMSASCAYHVDAETFLPLDMEMEILGMGDVMNDLLGTLMLGMDAGEMEFSIDVPAMKIFARNMVYNEAVEVPAVPQEAIDNAVDADAVLEDMTGTEDLTGMEEVLTNPPQEDGSFVITAGGDTVRVMVPEAYTVMESGEDAVVGVADNFYDTVYYMLYADMTAEDMEAMFNEELVWARENEWYGSHTEPAELNGYTTMGLVYNDDTSIWYAWRELNGSFLLVVAEADAVTFDLEGLLATVEIPA